MQLLIKHSHDLRNVVVPLYEGPNRAPELILGVLVQFVVRFRNRKQYAGDFCLRRLHLLCFGREVNFTDCFHIIVVIDTEVSKLFLRLVNEVNIDFFRQAGLLIVRLECLQNIFLRIHKVKNISILFSGISDSASGPPSHHAASYLQSSYAGEARQSQSDTSRRQ